MLRINPGKLIIYSVLIVMILALAVVFMQFFENIPTEGTSLGLDNMFFEMDNWDINYDVSTGLRNPPWTLLPLVPLGSLFSLRANWGLLVLFMIAACMLAVPRVRPLWRYALGVILSVFCFHALRTMADANQEGYIIAAVLALLVGYQKKDPVIFTIGVLFIPFKPQETYLLIIVVAVYVLQTWKVREWLMPALVTAAIVIPSMLWRGREWIEVMTNHYAVDLIINMSFWGTLNRIGLPVIVVHAAMIAVGLISLVACWFARRDISRDKAGMLIVASMLVAPYAAGNNLATVNSISLVPLFLVSPWVGGALIFLINFPGFWPRDLAFNYQTYWWTGLMVIIWAVLLWRIYHYEIRPTQAEKGSGDVRLGDAALDHGQ